MYLFTLIELQKLIQSRETLAVQETENNVVKAEFDSITDSSTPIYKLTGPVLVPQTKSEAEMNVNKRLEFITGEIKRVEEKITASQKKSEQKRNEVCLLIIGCLSLLTNNSVSSCYRSELRSRHKDKDKPKFSYDGIYTQISYFFLMRNYIILYIYISNYQDPQDRNSKEEAHLKSSSCSPFHWQ